MKRFNKVALIPAAVAAVLAGNAYAGTEACFEVYKVADGAGVTAHDQIFGGASCPTARAGASTTGLEAINETKIAYELTGNIDIEFTNVDGAISADEDDQHIVYIPTTDIPGGTKITMELGGATFAKNQNQIHLVKNDGTTTEAVASSDGQVDGENVITFITKAGVTIGAGTRLAFSKISTDVEPIGINIKNDVCTSSDSTQTVTIKSTYAKTDGGTGYNIIGGVSKEAQSIVDISAQFHAFVDSATSEAEVNAESSDSNGDPIIARTEFVYGDNNKLTVQKSQVIFQNNFYDRTPNLDQYVILNADDDLETTVVATSEPGTTVKAKIYNAQDNTSGVVSSQIDFDDASAVANIGLTEETATVYHTDANDLFTNQDNAANTKPNTSILHQANYNKTYYVVENTSTTGVMNFNYEVQTNYKLDFGAEGAGATPALLNHCKASKGTHKVGVNGAVLKVPYVVNAEGNFVRVTNEHDEAAEVTVDVFGESANGNTGARKVTAVELGQVPAKSSVVYFVPKLIEQAVAQKGYTGADGGYAAESLGTNAANAKSADNRHTVTFTVTAPKDSVHGVSVQKIIGGTDRVMPVLDENKWSQ